MLMPERTRKQGVIRNQAVINLVITLIQNVSWGMLGVDCCYPWPEMASYPFYPKKVHLDIGICMFDMFSNN